MKRVVVDRYGGPEVLRVVEEDEPRPGPGEVRFRVVAAGVSFTDALLLAGIYLGGCSGRPVYGFRGARICCPFLPPADEFAGVVQSVG